MIFLEVDGEMSILYAHILLHEFCRTSVRPLYQNNQIIRMILREKISYCEHFLKQFKDIW